MTTFSKILIGSLVMLSQSVMAGSYVQNADGTFAKLPDMDHKLAEQTFQILIPMRFVEAQKGAEIALKISDRDEAESSKSSAGSKVRNVKLYPSRIVEGKNIQCSLNSPYATGNDFTKAVVKEVKNGSTLMEVTREDGGVAYVSCYSKPAQSRKQGHELTKDLTAKEIQDYFKQGDSEMLVVHGHVRQELEQLHISERLMDNTVFYEFMSANRGQYKKAQKEAARK